MAESALIVGAGDGLSASFARVLRREGYTVALAARRPEKLQELSAEIDAFVFGCDATDSQAVSALFTSIDDQMEPLSLVLYNPSFRTRGSVVDLDPEDVRKAIDVSVFGGFLVAQQAARRMLQAGRGAILFTGASASIKGYAKSAPFAMGKFALRGLAQSMARELAPQNIHVAHFIIDGGIANPSRGRPDSEADNLLSPDAIAETYLQVARQHRSAWTWEVELRPWVENF